MMLPERVREVGAKVALAAGLLAAAAGCAAVVEGIVDTAIAAGQRPVETDFPSHSEHDPAYLSATTANGEHLSTGLGHIIDGLGSLGLGAALSIGPLTELAGRRQPNKKAARREPLVVAVSK